MAKRNKKEESFSEELDFQVEESTEYTMEDSSKSDVTLLNFSPDRCYSNSSVLNFESTGANIVSVESITPNVGGEVSNINSNTVTFKIAHSFSSLSAIIRVTLDNGNSKDFIINICPKLPMIKGIQ